MAPKPIIRPGPTAAGPPGWGERQQERLTSASEQIESSAAGDDSLTSSGGHSRNISHDSKGVPTMVSDEGSRDEANARAAAEDKPLGKMKGALHKIGEKLALVPPKNAEAGVSTQNASTMPESP